MALALVSISKQECFKEAKTVKTAVKFTIRDAAQCMGEHMGKQFVYPTQKQGRDTHRERKGMGIPSNKEECSKSEARLEIHTQRGVQAS